MGESAFNVQLDRPWAEWFFLLLMKCRYRVVVSKIGVPTLPMRVFRSCDETEFVAMPLRHWGRSNHSQLD